MHKDSKKIVETALELSGLKSFRDLAAILLIARKLQLNRTMHANMIYHAYVRHQKLQNRGFSEGAQS